MSSPGSTSTPRVLALADDRACPLLERVKFFAIFSSNLDEFFQVRVAALKDQVAAGITRPSPDGRTPAAAARSRSATGSTSSSREQERLLLDRLVPALRDAGRRAASRWDELDEDDRKHLDEVFEQRIFPVLTPLAVDPAHPFPYISNLSLNLARDRARPRHRRAPLRPGEGAAAAAPLPAAARRRPLRPARAGDRRRSSAILFPGMEIEEHCAFRVTRNADLTLAEERGRRPARRGGDGAAPPPLRPGRAPRGRRTACPRTMVELLLRELDLERDDVVVPPRAARPQGPVPGPRHRPSRPEGRPVAAGHQAAPGGARPRTSAASSRSSASATCSCHHPYESLRRPRSRRSSRQAADDPRVLTIKMTLYRTSGDSPIVRSLIRAAERGVQVAALVELKARFDEEANINWAKALERAGVHVVYGLVGLKTHSKTLLVVRAEADGIRRYVHIGTGNYNSVDGPAVRGHRAADRATPTSAPTSTQLFNHLTGYSRRGALPQDPRGAALPAPPRAGPHRPGGVVRRARPHRVQAQLARSTPT